MQAVTIKEINEGAHHITRNKRGLWVKGKKNQ